jgi:hypothetical protein
MTTTIDMSKHTPIQTERGMTLLITLLLMGVLLGVSASLLNITLKQFQFAGIASESEVAFQAANAGIECAQYRDQVDNKFDVPGNGTGQAIQAVSCMGVGGTGNGTAQSGIEQRFQFSWGGLCTEVSVYKFYNTSGSAPMVVNGTTLKAGGCPQGSECTYVQSRGYNVICSQLQTTARVVEREYTILY